MKKAALILSTIFFLVAAPLKAEDELPYGPINESTFRDQLFYGGLTLGTAVIFFGFGHLDSQLMPIMGQGEDISARQEQRYLRKLSCAQSLEHRQKLEAALANVRNTMKFYRGAYRRSFVTSTGLTVGGAVLVFAVGYRIFVYSVFQRDPGMWPIAHLMYVGAVEPTMMKLRKLGFVFPSVNSKD